jgi:hypothetical protein
MARFKIVRSNGEARRHWLALVRRAAFYLFWPVLALVIWDALTPGIGVPGMSDKVEHFLAFGCLGGLAGLVGKRRYAPWMLIMLIALGGILEIVQGFIGRDASWRDEIANSLGAIAGMLVATGLIRIECREKRAP